MVLGETNEKEWKKKRLKCSQSWMLLHYLAGCKTTKIKHKHIKIELQRTVIKKNLNSGVGETNYIRKAKVKMIAYCPSEIIQAKI